MDTVRNFQQAGLVVYVNDDLFTRLSYVAIWNTRQTEFGKEMPWSGGEGVSHGGIIVGPPAETTYLRITHRLDRSTASTSLRAWTSRDGRDWVKGGVWTLPADAVLKVGLVSQGRPPLTRRPPRSSTGSAPTADIRRIPVVPSRRDPHAQAPTARPDSPGGASW